MTDQLAADVGRDAARHDHAAQKAVAGHFLVKTHQCLLLPGRLTGTHGKPDSGADVPYIADVIIQPLQFG